MCTDAGFIKTVAPGHFFFHKGCWSILRIWWPCGVVENIQYLETVNRRHPKDGFVRIRKLVLYCKWRPITIKESWELRSELLLSGDGSHLCVRISNCLNTFVTDLTEKVRIHGDDENNSASTGRPVVQETRLMQTNPQQSWSQSRLHLLSLHPLRQVYQFRERNWIDIEHQGATQKDAPSLSYFEEHGCMAQTRNSSSKRRWSNWILGIENGIQIRLTKFCILVNSNVDRSSASRWRTKRRYFSFVLIRIGHTFFTSELSKVTREKILWISLHRTTYRYPTISSSSSIMSEVTSTCTLSLRQDWLREEAWGWHKFWSVDPMKKNWIEQEELDLTQPRYAAYKQKWKLI